MQIQVLNILGFLRHMRNSNKFAIGLANDKCHLIITHVLFNSFQTLLNPEQSKIILKLITLHSSAMTF